MCSRQSSGRSNSKSFGPFAFAQGDSVTTVSASIRVSHHCRASSRVHTDSAAHSPRRPHSSRAVPGRSAGLFARQASTRRWRAEATSNRLCRKGGLGSEETWRATIGPLIHRLSQRALR